MKIVVKDANVFIDMESMGIFELWVQLGYETYTSSLIVQELESGHHHEALAYIATVHIKVIDPPLEEVATLSGEIAGVSFQDASVLHIALAQDAFLLTGDKTLRMAAEVRNVECHGSIWVLDQLVRTNKLAGKVAAEKLYTLLHQTGENARYLPRKIADNYIKRWRKL